MTRNVTVLAAALLVACGGDKSPGTTDSGGTTPGTTCSNSVSERFPASGDADVYYKTDVRFTLTAADPAASISITDGAGAEVTGTTTSEANVVTWAGDDFAPATAYTATLSYECGKDVVTFTTSDTGSAVGDPTTLEGRVYALDLEHGQWVKPAGVGALLSSQLGGTQVLVSPSTVDATSITMLGAIGSADAQDLCSPSIDFPPADFNNPFFELTSPSLTLSVAGFDVTINNLDLSGAFAPDGSRIQGATLAGKIDTRPLGPLLGGGNTTDNTVCALVAGFGVTCEECDDGSGPFCLSVYIDNVAAPGIGGTLVPIDQAAIDGNPDCQ